MDIAFQMIKDGEKDFHFIVIGDGEERKILESLADQWGIQDYITFTGWQKTNKALYESIDLLLLTSKNEGTPVTVIEALVSGTPVVASDVGGVSDIMTHYEPKNLIASRNPDEYIQRILKIKNNNLTVTKQVQTRIKKKYSSGRLIDDITALYSQFIKNE